MEIIPISSSSKGNCYLAKSIDGSLLIECGSRWGKIRKALEFRTSYLDGILISHEHKDHSVASKDAIRSGINIYTTKGTAKAIGIEKRHRFHMISSGKKFSISDKWVVLPFETVHDAAEPVGFLVKPVSEPHIKIFFATDTGRLNTWSNSITHLLIECNHSEKILRKREKNGEITRSMRDRILTSHLSIENLVYLLKNNDTRSLREIYLLHLSDDNSEENEFKRIIQGLTGVPVNICKG
jgi:phosphoribosyl 1,2-cyclic phosphodiesterase